MDSREDTAVAAQPARRMTIADSATAADPLYKQVRAALVESLAAGEWKPGEVIPSERKLAERYGVAVATIRAATSELAAMKVLARRQGRGTYVCREAERRNIYQFFHVVRNDGTRGLPVSELVWIRKRRADLDTAHALDLPRDPSAQSVYLIRNILKVSGVPVVVSDISIAASRFPGLTEERIRTGGPTLYAVYQTVYGINIVHTDEKLRAVRCDADAARLLRIKRDEPVLEVGRLAYTFNDEVVEVRRSVVQTSDYHYALSRGGK